MISITYSRNLLMFVPVCLCFGLTVFSENSFREEFQNIDNWQPYFFKSIKRHTIYKCRDINGITFLEGHADAAASALEHKTTFNPYKHSVIEWRWRIRNVYKAGDARHKSGDDYPVRLYVNFPYNKKQASFRQKLTYEFAKKQLGHYPPHSAIVYIWANKAHSDRIIPNAYTDREQMIILRSTASKAGTWVTEKINILDDYRTAFNEDPPTKATLAIMIGSNNTGEDGLSFIDYIEVR